jgi:hypothetical protein
MEQEVPDDPVLHESAYPARKWRRIAWVLVLLIAAWVSMCLEQALNNTSWQRGLEKSVTVAAFFSPIMLLILVPVGLIGRAIGNLKPLRPFRWWISLSFPLALCAWPVVSAVRQRTDPALGFKHYGDTDLPKNARNVKAHIESYTLSDLSVSYSFECTPEETKRLIESLNLKRREAIPQSNSSRMFELGGNTLEFDNDNHGRHTGFIELSTDETMTQVVIHRWDT